MKYLKKLLLLGFVLVGAAGCYAAKSKDEKIPLENTSQPDNMKSLEGLKREIDNANSSVLSKVKDQFKKIIRHGKTDKIAPDFDRAINMVQYYLFDLAKPKKDLLDVLGKMKKTVSELSEVRYWSEVKTALDNFTPFKKVSFSSSLTTPIAVRNGVNNIVDALNKTLASLKATAPEKAREEKQTISDSAKSILVAKVKKSTMELLKSINFMMSDDQIKKTEGQIQTTAGNIAKNMEALLSLLGQTPEATIFKEIRNGLAEIAKSQVGWEKFEEKGKELNISEKFSFISDEDLFEIVMSYNALLAKLSKKVQEAFASNKKADAKKCADALIEALKKLKSVVPLGQIQAEAALIAKDVGKFIALLGLVPEAKELEDVKNTLETISKWATEWENLENAVHLKKVSDTVLKKRLDAINLSIISHDDLHNITVHLRTLLDTLGRRANLISLGRDIQKTFTKFDPTDNHTAFQFRTSNVPPLKERIEKTIKKINLPPSEQLKKLIASLEDMSKAKADANNLKELKIILIKTKIDPNPNPNTTTALYSTINELVETFNKSCDDLQKRMKTKTALLLDALAAGEKLRVEIVNDGDQKTAEGELKAAIKALQTDHAALEALKKYPEALLAATAEIKEPKTAEEKIYFEKMMAQFERYVRILILINGKTTILNKTTTDELIEAGLRGRVMLAKATAKSAEETQKTIDANLKKEADVKKDAKEQGSLLWRYTAGWLGY